MSTSSWLILFISYQCWLFYGSLPPENLEEGDSFVFTFPPKMLHQRPETLIECICFRGIWLCLYPDKNKIIKLRFSFPHTFKSQETKIQTAHLFSIHGAPTQQAERSRLQRAGPPPATPPRFCPSQGPASRSAALWQLHTSPLGLFLESLKPEHHGMTVDQLLWHHCVSEDYFLFRLFTLNQLRMDRACPTADCCDTSCV